MEISSIPSDLSEGQFRTVVVMVLDGFDKSIKDMTGKLDTFISIKAAEIDNRVKILEKDVVSRSELEELKTKNRRYWIGLSIPIVLSIAGLLSKFWK